MTQQSNLQPLIAHSWAATGIQHDLTKLAGITIVPDRGDADFMYCVVFTTNEEWLYDTYWIGVRFDSSHRFLQAEVIEYLPSIYGDFGQPLAGSETALDWLRPVIQALDLD